MIIIFINVRIRMVYPFIIDPDALYGHITLYMLPSSVHPTFTSILDRTFLDHSWNLNEATQKG
jgi:hypothetical protein